MISYMILVNQGNRGDHRKKGPLRVGATRLDRKTQVLVIRCYLQTLFQVLREKKYRTLRQQGALGFRRMNKKEKARYKMIMRYKTRRKASNTSTKRSKRRSKKRLRKRS